MLLDRISSLKIGEFGQVLIRFASSQLLSKLLNMISGFLVVRMLDPEELGLYNGAGIYLGYILVGHGGIINGLGRELPYQMGKGNDIKAKQLASSTWVLSTVLSIVASLIFLIISLYYLVIQEYVIAIVYFSYIITAFFFLMNKQFLTVLYRRNEDFVSLSKQNIKIGFGNIISVIFVFIFGFWGLLIRGIFLSVYQFLLLFINKPIELKWQYLIRDYKELFKIGLPIFSIGYINSLWTTIMSNIIFSFGGATFFGLYSLSTIIQGAIGVIPSAFSGITYPRMTIMFAEGKTIVQILKRNIKTLIFQFIFLLITAILAALLLPKVVSILLPQYIDGIYAAQWMCFVPVVQSFDVLNNIYNVVKKQKWLLISLIIGALVGLLFIIVSIKINLFYLAVFPQGLLIGILTQQILSLMFIKKLL